MVSFYKIEIHLNPLIAYWDIAYWDRQNMTLSHFGYFVCPSRGFCVDCFASLAMTGHKSLRGPQGPKQSRSAELSSIFVGSKLLLVIMEKNKSLVSLTSSKTYA